MQPTNITKSLLKTVTIVILSLMVVGLLARYVFFKQAIDEWGAGLERISQWEKDYKSDHPNASDEEVDQAFDSQMSGITQWREDYKENHPGASDAEAKAAWESAINKLAKWRQQYKTDHPEATEADIDAAWKAAWSD